MEKFRIVFVSLVLLLAVVLSGCVEGPGGITFELDDVKRSLSESCYGAYSDVTRVECEKAYGERESMRIAFPHKAKGAFGISPGEATMSTEVLRVSGGLWYTDDDGKVFYSPGLREGQDAWHRIVITSYEGVGGSIEGTFEGVVIAADEKSHRITNGHFRVKRTG